MSSLRRHEGYLMIDNRNSPGIPESMTQATYPKLPLGAGKGLFEAPTYTCSHCQSVVVLNPLRNRDRAYCPKCNHYLCDTCGVTKAATGICKPFKQMMEEIQERAELIAQNPSLSLFNQRKE